MTVQNLRAARRGREPWQNPVSGPMIDPDGNLCDAYGTPFPPEVQRLRQCVLPTPDMSADLMIRDAALAMAAWDRARPVSYACMNCRDGRDTPKGSYCGRCGL